MRKGPITDKGTAAQMASSDASPDVEPEADTQGKSRRRASAPVPRAVPAAPAPPCDFFQRLFGVHPQPAPTHRRLIGGVEQHDEPLSEPLRQNHLSFAYDRSTTSVL